VCTCWPYRASLRLPGWARSSPAGRLECMRRRLSAAAIGRWSARRPWLAIAPWLGFVVACVAGFAVTRSKQLRSGATGESARAEHMMRAELTFCWLLGLLPSPQDLPQT
jgi:hypothetical protein